MKYLYLSCVYICGKAIEALDFKFYLQNLYALFKVYLLWLCFLDIFVALFSNVVHMCFLVQVIYIYIYWNFFLLIFWVCVGCKLSKHKRSLGSYIGGCGKYVLCKHPYSYSSRGGRVHAWKLVVIWMKRILV